ncbi:imidazolonepropionase-like domain-containing protein [Streptomyces sp. NPDC053474]|uniref:imidazolonepropionase-like domain-containing protein n=1 Tax=Streptomyces sp. NPDC053474 TaxID=3365704 RepID=UPI0037D50348
MLTLHQVDAVRPAPAGADAVVVNGARIVAVGPYAELHAAYGERARVRRWDGVLTPGRHEPDAVALLESAYWPDPREADELGTDPLTGQALARLGMTDTRWGASARRGLQRLLATGTTTLAGPFTHPPVRTAVTRSGIRVVTATPPEAPLAPSALADFAIFTEDGTCLTTAIEGRLLFRRR